MAEFNLIDQAWIPCIDARGRRVEHGILETLLQSHALREVCDDSPLVTVALHRLLLAILYRIHGGPNAFEAWNELYDKGSFNRVAVTRYLSQFRHRFDLYATAHPFFQMAKLSMRKAVPVSRLAMECASGNNPTLFDHRVDGEEVDCPSPQAARWLVACQSFALGFGRGGIAQINGKEETLPYFTDAIALRGMCIWLQGESLFETLMINLVPNEDASSPAWELDDPHKYRDRHKGKTRSKAIGAFGLIDRLTWQSRLVRFRANDDTPQSMYFGQGRSADKSPGDPMKVYRASKEEGIIALRLSSGKAAWRDSHSIFMIPGSDSHERRPECFNLVARIRPEKQFVAHVVGLASAPQKPGKFLLWRHERMPVPARLLADVNLIERLGRLLEDAEQAAVEQRSRTWRIARFYRVPKDREPGKKEKEDINALVLRIDPRPAYWARLEKHFFALLAKLPDDWDALEDDWKPDNQQEATRAWRGHVKDEARRALEESIRTLGTTARAIQAVGRVRTDFIDDDLKGSRRKLKTERGPKGGNRQ